MLMLSHHVTSADMRSIVVYTYHHVTSTHFVALYSVMTLPDVPALHVYFVVMWQVESKRGQQMTKADVRDGHSNGQI